MKRVVPDLIRYEDADWETSLKGLAEVKVRELLEESVPAISPRATVRELLFRMAKERRTAYVVWEDEPTGSVSQAEALLGYASGMNAKVTRVRDIARGDDMFVVNSDTPALPLVIWMFENNVPLVAICDGEAFQGIVTPSSALSRMAKAVLREKVAAV